MVTNMEYNEDLEVCLREVQDEFQKLKFSMVDKFKVFEETMNRLMESANHSNYGGRRAGGGNEIHGAPIFDVYDDEEPSMAVRVEATKEEYSAIYDGDPIFDFSDDNLAVLRFEYFEKNIQVTDSRITLCIPSSDRVINDSSFGSSRRTNESFKEIIDRSSVEALSTQLWIRSVTQKFYWHASSPPTRPIKSHEPLTSSPKKPGGEEQVPRKPPPLRDKKFAQIIWLGEETKQLHTSFNGLRRTLRTRFFGGWSIDENITG